MSGFNDISTTALGKALQAQGDASDGKRYAVDSEAFAKAILNSVTRETTRRHALAAGGEYGPESVGLIIPDVLGRVYRAYLDQRAQDGKEVGA